MLLFGCFVKGSFNTQRGVKNLIGQFGVLHPLHPQCGCSSVKMCEQRTWTVCCFLLGPKPITLESISTAPCEREVMPDEYALERATMVLTSNFGSVTLSHQILKPIAVLHFLEGTRALLFCKDGRHEIE